MCELTGVCRGRNRAQKHGHFWILRGTLMLHAHLSFFCCCCCGSLFLQSCPLSHKGINSPPTLSWGSRDGFPPPSSGLFFKGPWWEQTLGIFLFTFKESGPPWAANQGSNGRVYWTEVTTQSLQTSPHMSSCASCPPSQPFSTSSAHTGPIFWQFFLCEEGRFLFFCLSWFRMCRVNVIFFSF